MGWDGVLYCLDPVADTDAEVTALSAQIWGHDADTETAIATAQTALHDAIKDLEAAMDSGDQATIDEARAAYHAALAEVARLVGGDAPVVDINSSVREQIAGLDRMRAERLLELERARQDLEQASLGGETQAAEARVELIENVIRSLDDAVTDKCSELRQSGDALPPAC